MTDEQGLRLIREVIRMADVMLNMERRIQDLEKLVVFRAGEPMQ